MEEFLLLLAGRTWSLDCLRLRRFACHSDLRLGIPREGGRLQERRDTLPFKLSLAHFLYTRFSRVSDHFDALAFRNAHACRSFCLCSSVRGGRSDSGPRARRASQAIFILALDSSVWDVPVFAADILTPNPGGLGFRIFSFAASLWVRPAWDADCLARVCFVHWTPLCGFDFPAWAARSLARSSGVHTLARFVALSLARISGVQFMDHERPPARTLKPQGTRVF